MMRMRWILAGLAAIVVLPCTARAVDRFDVIYPSRLDLYMPAGSAGLELGNLSYILLVNTGSTPISAAETSQITFDCVSSAPGFTLAPILGDLPSFAPIAPGEAVGSVKTMNHALLNLIGAGEVFRVTTGQVLAVDIGEPDPPGNYVGVVHFSVDLHLGNRKASFETVVGFHLSTGVSLTFTSVARSTSNEVVAATPMTWGKLKSLYR